MRSALESGMATVGGVGMLGNWAYQTFFIGPKLDANKIAGMTELQSGQSVLGSINLLPILLVVAFAGLYFFVKEKSVA